MGGEGFQALHVMQAPDLDNAVPGDRVEEGAIGGEGEDADGVDVLHPGEFLTVAPRLQVVVLQRPIVEILAEAGERGYLLELAAGFGWAPEPDFEPRSPVTVGLATEKLQHVKDFLQDHMDMLKLARQNVRQAQDRYKKYADEKRRQVIFKEGDYVFLRVPEHLESLKTGPTPKLLPIFCGPFKILRRVGSMAYKLELPANSRVHPVFHYDNYFQLAFQDGEVWDLQEEIFKLHEQGKLKGQKLSKSHASFKGKGASKEDSPKTILEDMKITPWRQLQGIHEKSLIYCYTLCVKGGSISLEQMGEEFERIKPNIHGCKLDHLSWASLKKLPDEFQEVGIKSMVSDPCFFDASGEPQPPIGSEKVGEIVDFVDFELDTVDAEEQASDTPLQITLMGEETRNEEEEDLPIQA
ncbi:hypothetical protein L7F22_024753 [Adiantum nelumboides]|nr:hypothetical protein [Adiantum nelumboides]